MSFPQPLSPTFYRRVQDKLRTTLAIEELDGILLLDTHNVIYSSGFFHSANERPIGLYVPLEGDPSLFVPLLEKENAEDTWITDIRTYEEFPGLEHPVLWMIRSCGAKHLGIDSLSASLYPQATALVLRLVLTDALERQRYLKEPEELELIRTAARYADACLDAIYASAGDIIRAGGTELEILNEGVRVANALLKGDLPDGFAQAKNLVVGTVHTGARAALPHGKTLPRTPQAGETLIAGIGASVGGYHAESGVTLVLGEMTNDQEHCLRAAEACNDAAIAALRKGSSCQSVNDAALCALKEAGLAPFIRHRIGHGMGIGGHEAPWLAPGDNTPVAANMVFSNEPGIYRPGIDGYRTINTMIVTLDGIDIPSTFQARHPLSSRIIPL